VKQAVGDKGLYAIHNNAGIADIASGMIAGVSLEETKKIFDINLFGMIRVIQAFLPLIHQWGKGRILNMSSGNARVAVPTAGPYMMTKMGVEALTRTLRMEMAPWGIDVTSIEPGGVKTPMTHNADANMRRKWEVMPEWVRNKYEKTIRPANDNLLKSLDNANEPELIADKIIHALTVPNPKIRYVAGNDVKYLPLAQNLMSEERFENVLLKKFGLKRNSEV
jgi:NAD(P)-dependent dehydrogenase (short-subunit alcohol dehydrogenase family)